MSHLITPEASPCKCFSCLGHSDGNIHFILGDCHFFLHSFVGLTTVTLLAWKGVASPSPDSSLGAGATIQTAGVAGSLGFLWLK